MARTGREFQLARRPVGEPQPTDFRLADVAIAKLGADEVLIKNAWLSVDPYMRGRMDDVKSYVAPYALNEVMTGFAVGIVIESRSAAVPEGVSVIHGLGWRELAVAPAADVRIIDVDAAPATSYLSVLGMTGLTAYVGLKVVAPVQEDETVFISAAAGSVGSIAGDVARKLGAGLVIGSAGGAAKKARLTEELGFDAAIDYREGPVGPQLRAIAPGGIDIYFDNVGGDHLSAAVKAARNFARFALCGTVSHFTSTSPATAPDLRSAVGKRLNMRGFIVGDHEDLYVEYLPMATQWLADGDLKDTHTAVDGFENTAAAFIDMLRGANTGKMLVRLA